MKTAFQKYMRANLDQHIIQHYKRLYPHFEFEQNTRKIPLYPKIVVYSNVASVDKFLEQIFPAYKVERPKPSNETDEAFTKRIATELVYPSQQKSFPSGVILQGFPFNTSQALTLDRFLNGVNLALHVRSGKGSSEYAELLQYYEDRGTLLTIDHLENPSAEQLEHITREIVGTIKLTEF